MEIDLSDPQVLRDPFSAYGKAREQAPVVRLVTPGFGHMWAVTRHANAKTLLSDPRVALTEDTYLPLQVPEHCRKYLRTMQQTEGEEHARLRRLVSPAFTARRAAAFRPRIEQIVDRLLDDLDDGTGRVDFLTRLAQPLPMDVITELVGIPVDRRDDWRAYGAAIAAGQGRTFVAAIPEIMRDAETAVAARTGDPGPDLLSELIGVPDRLTATELVTLVWHLVLAGQTPAVLVANAVELLLTHPAHLAALRADPGLAPTAVEEMTRWAGPQLLTLPRWTREPIEIAGTPIEAGQPVTVALAAVNRDPRAFPDPERLDFGRPAGGHLGYAYGPHFCLGAALARVQVEVAVTALLKRFPGIALAAAERMPDPGAWRLRTLEVAL
ncbi:cytochrome P450 [Actinoplanes sp. RD1]|uniref:cytochrome P450 n=1 Tax=Actinoplanes sp. RD1 TaxID=3064538 RepID=UPI002741F098|nr:cytochrome P450 [Actinoplanes sp. RD1]